MYNVEFAEKDSERKSLSKEDEMFLNVMKNNIRLDDDGHYILPLPFRETNLNLPNNKLQALKRYSQVKRRMLRDEKYKE